MIPSIAANCSCDLPEISEGMLSVAEAQDCAMALVTHSTETELVQLSQALGRVASRELCASRPMPFFDNSAMDGFAVSISTLASGGPWSLPITGLAEAGSDACKKAEFVPGTAVRILTGARVPNGFDAVIPQELCQYDKDTVRFEKCPRLAANIRFEGSDSQCGAVLVTRGTRIEPHHIGLLAANGYGAINVRRMPTVAIFSTGDELAKPGNTIEPGQIYDCNKPMLTALVAQLGAEVIDLGSLPDDLDATIQLLTSCKAKYDLVISTGSVSVGDRDFLKAAFEAAGGQVRNWKVAVKPGKPVMFGKLGDAVFTGLPGNPFAAYVGFQLFVKRQLQLLSGGSVPSIQTMTAVTDFSWDRKAGREEYFPVLVNRNASVGSDIIHRLGNSVSATLYPLAAADGLGWVSADCSRIRPGDLIQWQAF